MLARSPYKTAAELGIQETEYEGLVAFVADARDGALETDRGVHVFNYGTYVPWNGPKCGTVGCIAGYIKHKTGFSDFSKNTWGNLYAPGIDSGLPDSFSYDKVSLGRAAFCVENFLSTGEINWGLALEVAR